MTQGIAHSALAALVIVGYVVLTITGNDGNVLLGVLGGQGLTVATTEGVNALQGKPGA
jgi:hypothetical protein